MIQQAQSSDFPINLLSSVQIFGEREIQNQPFVMPVGGYVCQARLAALCRVERFDRMLIKNDVFSAGLANGSSDERSQFRLAIAFDSGDANDLAGADAQRINAE